MSSQHPPSQHGTILVLRRKRRVSSTSPPADRPTDAIPAPQEKRLKKEDDAAGDSTVAETECGDDVDKAVEDWDEEEPFIPDTFIRQDLHPRDKSDSTTVLRFQDWTKLLKTRLAMLARFVNAEKAVEYIEMACGERSKGVAWLTAEDVREAINKAEENGYEERHRPGTFWG